MKKALVLYLPVLHEGYRRLLEKHRDADAYLLLGEELTGQYRQLQKDLRALPADLICQAVAAWNLGPAVEIAGTDVLANLPEDCAVVMPEDEVCRETASLVWGARRRVQYESVFLRWDKQRAGAEQAVESDSMVTDWGDWVAMELAEQLAAQSSDWWRRIGALLLRDRKVIVTAFNRHVPHPQQPYVDGDPRAEFRKGVNIELSTALHAEVGIIAEAARRGIATAGCHIYVTTFPCPPCAKLIAYSGITRCYFRTGYSMLDAQRILKSQGIEIVKVDTENPLPA